jgi:hypothetical protein
MVPCAASASWPGSGKADMSNRSARPIPAHRVARVRAHRGFVDGEMRPQDLKSEAVNLQDVRDSTCFSVLLVIDLFESALGLGFINRCDPCHCLLLPLI